MVPPCSTSSCIYFTFIQLGPSKLSGWVALGVCLLLGIASFSTAKAVEQSIAKKLLYRFVAELNSDCAHEVVFSRYSPYICLRSDAAKQSDKYEISILPLDLVSGGWTYGVEIVRNPISMRWELSKPWSSL